MKITERQFEKILDNLNITTLTEDRIIKFNFDNNYFAVEGSYCIGSDIITDLEVYIEDSSIEISDFQMNKLWNLIEVKVVELEHRKSEDREILKYKELGF